MKVTLTFLAPVSAAVVDVSLLSEPQAASAVVRLASMASQTAAFLVTEGPLFRRWAWRGRGCGEIGALAAALGAAAALVDHDDADQRDPEGDLLPERLEAEDDEAVGEHGGDRDPDDGAQHGADAAAEAGAADHDGEDGLQHVGLVAVEGGGLETRQAHEAGQPG